MVFIKFPVTTIELVTSPGCVSLSEIAKIPQSISFLDQWDSDLLDNYHSLLLRGSVLVARAAMLFLFSF